MEHIVTQTNLYTQEALSPVQYTSWEDTTVDEFQAYFGLYILMTLMQMEQLDRPQRVSH